MLFFCPGGCWACLIKAFVANNPDWGLCLHHLSPTFIFQPARRTGATMAVRLSLSDVDLSCPICCEIFKEPVVLKCSHSFCAGCLREYWRRGGNRECPLCRSRSTDDPVPSLTLRNLCQSCVEEGGAEEREAGRELAIPPGEMCPLHEERLKLFCTVDDEPICVVCHTSRRHKAHDCCPVGEAVEGVKVNTVTDRDEDDDNGRQWFGF